ALPISRPAGAAFDRCLRRLPGALARRDRKPAAHARRGDRALSRDRIIAADAPRRVPCPAALSPVHAAAHADAGPAAHDTIHLLPLPLRTRTLHAVRSVPAR